MGDFLKKYKGPIGGCVVMATLCLGVFFSVGQSPAEIYTSIGQSMSVVGNISVGGGIQFGTAGDSKPACNEGNRGMMWTERGGAGVADETVICSKDASDEYAWSSLGYEEWFTLTGGDDVYDITIDGVDYRVHAFTTVGSHTLTVEGNVDPKVDAFLVGGGGGGTGNTLYGGGGGGYTHTEMNYSVIAGEQINIEVGQGGTGSIDSISDNEGGSSSFGEIIALGAVKGTDDGDGPDYRTGGHGGSGGGASGNNSGINEGGYGGSDGSDGQGTLNYPDDPNPWRTRGQGQGTTTRAFEQPDGELFAGGGGGAGDSNSGGTGDSVGGLGGEGGGGDGAGSNNNFTPSPGEDGKGGGGGAGSRDNPGADGGSGIVIVRYEI